MSATANLAGALLEIIDDQRRVLTSDAALDQHASDLSYHPAQRPDVVVYAETTTEIAQVLSYANEQGLPVTPFGAGTSVEGHVIPLHGGISLDLSRMTKIVDLSAQDLMVTVQAGVTRSQLAAAAGPHGLWFPVDPGADATLGGMAATNASGTTTVRYGGMHRQVLALEAVLANGQIIRTGTRAVKTSAGYDLTNLLIGSEGTLAVISELTLRLYPILEHVVAARVAFPTVEAACRAAAALISVGVSVTRCELIDAATIAALRATGSLDLEQVPHLLIEFAGSQTSVADDIETTRELVEAEGGRDVAFEADPTARARLWRARHNAAIALLALAPGSTAMTTDVAVPISELPDAIEAARVALDASGLRGGILGHVGDGSFHVMYLLAGGDSASIAQAAALNDAVVADALARGGTCTGEHGIGFGKLAYLQREHPELVSLYSGIKSLFDPKGILNPGKLVPEAFAPGS